MNIFLSTFFQAIISRFLTSLFIRNSLTSLAAPLKPHPFNMVSFKDVTGILSSDILFSFFLKIKKNAIIIIKQTNEIITIDALFSAGDKLFFSFLIVKLFF